MRVAVLDGYTDEPSSLGVPPFLAPLPRYIFGAVLDAGHEAEYLTIDDVRREGPRWRRAAAADVLVVVAGAVVPGRYLATMPLSPREARRLASHRGTTVFAGACAAAGIAPRGGGDRLRVAELRELYDHVVPLDPDAFIHDLLIGGGTPRRRTLDEWGRWAWLGAAVAEARDDLDHMVADIDASRGCVRYLSGGCSFCLEPRHGEPEFRSPDSVRREAAALMDRGVRYLRIGGMADVMSYLSRGIGETERPVPDPGAVERLLRGISGLAPDVLHLDNADPGMIAEHPREARSILRSIVVHCSPGNVLSLGLETADPGVARLNNLNSTAGEALEAIRTINAIGSIRGENGLPALLPGLNFVMGLRGETKATVEANRSFLRRILDEGLLLRRINIRQVMWPSGEVGRSRFIRPFRAWVREEVDRPMLERLLPAGTVLRRVYTEIRVGHVTFGRQPGTYPLLVGIPYDVGPGRFLDVVVTSHGPRSVTAVEYPLDANTAPPAALMALPGIGRKRAARIVCARPFGSMDELARALDDPDLAGRVGPFIRLGWPAGPADRADPP